MKEKLVYRSTTPVGNERLSRVSDIGVREGGAGGGGGLLENHYLFGQKLSGHSGNGDLVIRRIYFSVK